MKTPRYTSDYADNIKEATPFLPKGCRFLKEGEIIPEGARYIDHRGVIIETDCNKGNEYSKHFYIPCFVKAAKSPAPKRDRIGDLEKEVKALRGGVGSLKASLAKVAEALKGVAKSLEYVAPLSQPPIIPTIEPEVLDCHDLLQESQRLVVASAHPDSNIEHLQNVLVGYRDYVRNRSERSDFSPDGARDTSWRLGKKLARLDLGEMKE